MQLAEGDSAGTERSGARTHMPEAISWEWLNDRDKTQLAEGCSEYYN